MIIDFHTHTFPASISARALEKLSKNGHTRPFGNGTIDGLCADMRRAGVDYAVNLAVMTRPEQTPRVNRELIEQREAFFERGIISFGGIHPAYENWKTEIRTLAENGIKGIKLHPAFQGTQINDIRYKRIIASASEAGLITLVHCGLDIGFLNHNYSTVMELLDVIRDVQPEKLVLAHMGGWQAWNEVELELAGAPVWLDSAFSLGPFHARPGDEDLVQYRENLDSEAFVRLTRKHGSERVLFATDSPWADQSKYLEFIQNCDWSDMEKAAILGGNAQKLLELE